MNEQQDRKTILVIEDNPLNMKLAADLLELNGFNVIKAFDGVEALEILKKRKPDLILLDIRMPGMDGFEVFRRIRQDKELGSIKVIALTAAAMKEKEQKIRSEGFNGYITKPIDTRTFVSEIKEMF